MRRLGAEIRLHGDDFDAAKVEGQRFAEAEGLTFVVDGAEPTIAEGAGTMALEITREVARRGRSLDMILVPLGNGALLTGIGTWMKSKMPGCQVVGIVAEVAPAMLLSWQQGRAIGTETAPSIADGIAVRVPVPLALETMKTTVDDVWTVSEASIREAMRFCHRHYGLVIEPAGAVGVAAALEHAGKVRDRSVSAILCGGNMTPEQVAEYLR
jgi:threonine dehydratase